MLADLVAERTDDVFPALRSVLVADQSEAEQVMRSARADIAMLALELRVLRRDLAVAEAAVDRRPDGADLPDGAGELLATALEHWVSRRRSELAVDAERVRAEAARLVTAAQAEAAAVVAASGEEMVTVLLGRAPRLLDPPIFGVVRDALSPGAPSAPATLQPPVASAPAAFQAPVPASSPAEQAEAEHTIDDAPPTPAHAAPRVSFWARYLYVDVLLPLVAVLIVVVVLLAWVG